MACESEDQCFYPAPQAFDIDQDGLADYRTYYYAYSNGWYTCPNNVGLAPLDSNEVLINDLYRGLFLTVGDTIHKQNRDVSLSWKPWGIDVMHAPDNYKGRR
ncbi:MAG: hypothetical protein IH946_12610, partial [Bacteroidetes bacterium]|nr:hypothetical protein [Bacteroidota bacterium]